MTGAADQHPPDLAEADRTLVGLAMYEAAQECMNLPAAYATDYLAHEIAKHGLAIIRVRK